MLIFHLVDFQSFSSSANLNCLLFRVPAGCGGGEGSCISGDKG